MKVRKKPIVVEAIELDAEFFDGPHPNPRHPVGVVIDPTARVVTVRTATGRSMAREGDFLIVGPHDVYPISKKILEETFEVVEP